MTYQNGNVYIGQFKYTTLSGYGKLIWKNGDYFIGNFIDGKREK